MADYTVDKFLMSFQNRIIHLPFICVSNFGDGTQVFKQTDNDLISDIELSIGSFDEWSYGFLDTTLKLKFQKEFVWNSSNDFRILFRGTLCSYPLQSYAYDFPYQMPLGNPYLKFAEGSMANYNSILNTIELVDDIRIAIYRSGFNETNYPTISRSWFPKRNFYNNTYTTLTNSILFYSPLFFKLQGNFQAGEVVTIIPDILVQYPA